jgi:hypothetical protein
VLGEHRQLASDLSRELTIGLGDLGVRCVDQNGSALVPTLDHAGVDGNLAQELDPELFGDPPAPALTEDVVPSTGTLTFSNILRPLRASIRDRSLEVVTMTAPERGAC